ncbi:MAG: crossover junction endodeoxyribonuclease RuvC [Verrucomicrobiales bacterium]|nr:crossover junction endodeoxyribonuclease RuvC [Verrucomicrobiales bacterium]MCP5528293.1 crossover junction endodeoxyribonuclease RuvC [Verrucomicrobiales bacterium]
MGFTRQQFEVMQQRTGSRTGRSMAAREPAETPPRKPVGRILGVDPSLRGTGLGLIDQADTQPRPVHFEVVKCPAGWRRSRCLARIADATRDAIQRHAPEVCVVEGLFYAQNLQTALIMGEARGACLAAVAGAGLDIFELAPRRVKQAIVGYGAAGKHAVARMVQRLLALETLPPDDAADALALALVFAQEQKRLHLAAPRQV